MRSFNTASLLFASTTALLLSQEDQAQARPSLFPGLDLNQNGIPDLEEAMERAEREAAEAQAKLDEAVLIAEAA